MSAEEVKKTGRKSAVVFGMCPVCGYGVTRGTQSGKDWYHNSCFAKRKIPLVTEKKSG